MRAAARIAVLALALGVPAAAQASNSGYSAQFFANADGTGSVTGSYSCQSLDCPTYTPPYTLRLDRGGQPVASATGSGSITLPARPVAGDVLHYVVDGADRATETYDGLPAFDDTSCAGVGKTSLAGRVNAGHSELTARSAYGGTASVARSGDRFTATFAKALVAGEEVQAASKGFRMLSSTDGINVQSLVTFRLCPPSKNTGATKCTIPPANGTQSPFTRAQFFRLLKASVTGFRDAGIRALLSGGSLGNVITCARGRLKVTVTARHRRKRVVVAKGKKSFSYSSPGRTGLKVRPTRAGRRLLKRARKARLTVSVRVFDAQGHSAGYTKRVTMRRGVSGGGK